MSYNFFFLYPHATKYMLMCDFGKKRPMYMYRVARIDMNLSKCEWGMN